jgi:hypothetical protein
METFPAPGTKRPVDALALAKAQYVHFVQYYWFTISREASPKDADRLARFVSTLSLQESRSRGKYCFLEGNVRTSRLPEAQYLYLRERADAMYEHLYPAR